MLRIQGKRAQAEEMHRQVLGLRFGLVSHGRILDRESRKKLRLSDSPSQRHRWVSLRRVFPKTQIEKSEASKTHAYEMHDSDMHESKFSNLSNFDLEISFVLP
jgi:hypothetical protein